MRLSKHFGYERRSEEHTSELQSHVNLVCRLLLEKKVAASARVDARLLYASLRFSGSDRAMRASIHEVPPGSTPRSLLQKLGPVEDIFFKITRAAGCSRLPPPRALSN